MTTSVPVPYFPAPPAQYSQSHMAQVVRAFAVFAQQVNNPGPLQATTLTLHPQGVKIDAGELSYNLSEDTLNLTHLNNVTQQIGFETFMRARNDTGVTIPNGTVVGFSGVNGNIEIAPYIANGTVPELYFVGVTTFEMVDGAVGPVTIYGQVRGLNTTGSQVSESWSAGDILYASPTTAGSFTKVRPTAPAAVVVVAAVIDVDATNGSILVRPTIPLGLSYGTFSSGSDQTLSAVDTATAVTFDTTRISNGVAIGSPSSRLVVEDSGFYQVGLSAQVTSSSASAKNVYFWLEKNGTGISDSTRVFTIVSNNTFFPFSTVYDVSLLAGDYVQIMWAADSTDVRLDATVVGGFAPSSPSMVVSVTQIQL